VFKIAAHNISPPKALEGPPTFTMCVLRLLTQLLTASFYLHPWCCLILAHSPTLEEESCKAMCVTIALLCCMRHVPNYAKHYLITWTKRRTKSSKNWKDSFVLYWNKVTKKCVNPDRKPWLGIFHLQLDIVAVIFGSKWKEGVILVSKKIVSYVSATQ